MQSAWRGEIVRKSAGKRVKEKRVRTWTTKPFHPLAISCTSSNLDSFSAADFLAFGLYTSSIRFRHSLFVKSALWYLRQRRRDQPGMQRHIVTGGITRSRNQGQTVSE